jgi:ribosomal-protein-alanine N-acetyltransferase
MSCSRLETERLLLRPQEAGDIGSLVPLLNDFEVAKNLANVPHPYAVEDAEAFIARGTEHRAKGQGYPFALVAKADMGLVGGCGLRLQDDGYFELGYWIGRPFWGRGYASEAARRVAGFAFHQLKAITINAGWFHDNPASGRVLAKLGAVPAGTDHRNCLARGHAVYCYKVVLDRENFGRKR